MGARAGMPCPYEDEPPTMSWRDRRYLEVGSKPALLKGEMVRHPAATRAVDGDSRSAWADILLAKEPFLFRVQRPLN